MSAPNLNFSRPEFLPENEFDVKVHEEQVNNEAGEKNKSEAPPQKKKYVMEIRHTVSVEHPDKGIEKTSSTPLKITVTASNEKAATNEFNRTLNALNTTANNNFASFFNKTELKLDSSLYQDSSHTTHFEETELKNGEKINSFKIVGRHKIENLPRDTGKTSDKTTFIPLYLMIGRAISRLVGNIFGHKKESVSNQQTLSRPITEGAGSIADSSAKENSSSVKLSSSQQSLSDSVDETHTDNDSTHMSIDLNDDDIDFDTDDFEIEDHEKNEIADNNVAEHAHVDEDSKLEQKPNIKQEAAPEQSLLTKASPPDPELSALKNLLAQAGPNTRIKLEPDGKLSMKELGTMSAHRKTGAQTEALQTILKTLISKTNEHNMDQIIPLFTQLKSIKNYDTKLANHPELAVMHSALALLINVKIASAAGMLKSNDLTKCTQDFNKLTDAYRSNPSLQEIKNLKDVLFELSKELLKAKCDLGEVPHLADTNAYIQLIGRHEENKTKRDELEKVKETIIWGHRNNPLTKNLIGDIKDRLPLADLQENKNMLKFVQDYLNNGHSMPIDPQERQVVLASIFDIGDTLQKDLPAEALTLKQSAAKEIQKNAVNYLSGIRLPSKPEARATLFNTLQVLAENLSDDEDTRSIGENLLQLSDQAKALQEAKAEEVGPDVNVENIAIAESKYFEENSAGEIFQNLTTVASNKFIAVEVGELDFQGWAKDSTKEYANTISDYTRFINQTSNFLINQMLKVSSQKDLSDDQKQMAFVNNLKKTLEIADLAMGKEGQTNTSLVVAINAAVVNSSVERLRREGTPGFELLSDTDKAILAKLDAFASPWNDNINQRIATNQASLKGESTIPFLGIISTDVVFLLDKNPPSYKDNINAIQTNKMAEVKKNIVLTQENLRSKNTGIENNPSLKGLEENLSLKFPDEIKFYEMSMKILPRKLG